MKKVTIKGVDGKEIEAYLCSDHPNNFPTDMTDHKVEEVDLNNLNELDVNENSAGGGAHANIDGGYAVHGAGGKKKKCCGGSCHDKKDKKGFPNMVTADSTEEEIKEWVKQQKSKIDLKYETGNMYDSPLGKAFEFNVNLDPIANLFKMVSKESIQNKEIDDTIESDLIETEDLRLGRLYRVAGMNLVARFVAQITIPVDKTLLQIKHHGTILYVEERSLVKATELETKGYLKGE